MMCTAPFGTELTKRLLSAGPSTAPCGSPSCYARCRVGLHPAFEICAERNRLLPGRAILALGVIAISFAANAGWAAASSTHGPSEVVFLAEIIALLVCGRVLGEVMTRIGQPAVMGQLIAGILLGPSILGAIWPEFQHWLFPRNPEQRAMIDAVAQLGILLLLLVTGMETDLSVVRRSRRTAFAVSICGILVPFLCGVVLGEFLSAWMLPDPERRLVTTLFLGTALSISSVKIVAMVVREVGFLRRSIGQVIVAAAIIDDTIGWIVMSVVFGLALHGAIDFGSLAWSLAGVALFLLLSFTIGRRCIPLIAGRTTGSKVNCRLSRRSWSLPGSWP